MSSPLLSRRLPVAWLCAAAGAGAAVLAYALLAGRVGANGGLQWLLGLACALGGGGLALALACRSRAGASLGDGTPRDELRALARRIITLQEDERHRLSRELHDDIGQEITAIKLSVQLLADDNPARRAEAVAEVARIADQTVHKLRDISLLLRPPQLDALGLVPALRWQADTLARADGPALELQLQALPERPAPDVEVACFRIAQEALTNALRHSRAGSVRLSLQCDGGWLHLRVHDDGRGFDHGHTSGLGLVTMRERALQVGGGLDIEAGPGLGTRISARLPLRPAGTAN